VKKRLKMRDLERLAGVGREAIRFYIHAGLLPEPERPARNVAWYDESFVERILLIKRLQNERYLPLAVIKAIVSGGEAPPEAEARTLRDLEPNLTPAILSQRRRVPERLSALAKRVGLRAAEIRGLADAGLVEVNPRDGDQWLEGSAVTLVELWADLRAAGFTREIGFEPRDAALYVQFVNWLAREELRIFTRNVTGKVDAERAREMAQRGVEILNRILCLVHENAILRLAAEGNVQDSSAEEPPASTA
jgi:DNA-binding transcriptional MerR regulator